MADLIQKVKKILPTAVKTRRHLHEYPEVSSHEYKTVKYLKKQIENLGLNIYEVEGTGFYAVFDTGLPGKTLGLRTDIDALPILESKKNLRHNKAVISKNHGVSHACGHDGHMAILLASIELIINDKELLKGRVIFIFEEGEEIGSGIEPMIEGLKKENLDAIYGNHLYSAMNVGTISVDEGPVMAGASKIEFKVHGKTGHGSRPDLAINPIFSTAQVLTGISSAWNNRLDVNKTTTLGLTQIHGGSQNNIIADYVSVGGSLRFFDVEEGKKATNLLYDVATKTAGAHLSRLEITGRKIFPPLINDKRLSQIVQKGIQEVLPGVLVNNKKWLASEPFSFYRELCPIVYAFVGIKNVELGSGAEHHTQEFDLDEKSLFYGITSMVKFTLNYLSND